jgi:hypothetical protein
VLLWDLCGGATCALMWTKSKRTTLSKKFLQSPLLNKNCISETLFIRNLWADRKIAYVIAIKMWKLMNVVFLLCIVCLLSSCYGKKERDANEITKIAKKGINLTLWNLIE